MGSESIGRVYRKRAYPLGQALYWYDVCLETLDVIPYQVPWLGEVCDLASHLEHPDVVGLIVPDPQNDLATLIPRLEVDEVRAVADFEVTHSSIPDARSRCNRTSGRRYA